MRQQATNAAESVCHACGSRITHGTRSWCVQASQGGAQSGHASDGKPPPNIMDPGDRGGRSNALYIAAAAALGVAFWWRYARKSGATPYHNGNGGD